MKKIIVVLYPFIFFLLLIIPQAGAQEVEEKMPNALLWKISGKKLKEPSYLFGTVHAICADDMIFSEGVMDAMQNCRQLALEIDISDKNLLLKMESEMLMKDNTQLQDLLPPGEYELLHDYFYDSLGVDLEAMQQMKPIFLSSLIYSKLLGCIPQSYESQLSVMAEHQKMEVSGIETIEEQIKVFEKISYQEQAEMLLQTIVEYPDLVDAYWNMIVSYKNQDLKSLYHIITDIEIGMKKYEKLMVTDRNQRWIPRIEQTATRKPTFFAVGAAHLPGEKGVIALLKRRGYTVEPIFD